MDFHASGKPKGQVAQKLKALKAKQRPKREPREKKERKPVNRTVPPYTGQDQQSVIAVPARIAYKSIDWEEACWVMPPYAAFYPPPQQAAPARAWLPPPLFKTDFWAAQQTWPL